MLVVVVGGVGVKGIAQRMRRKCARECEPRERRSVRVVDVVVRVGVVKKNENRGRLAA